MKDLNKAKQLLQELADTANRAVNAINENKPNWEICNIAVDDIEELTDQINSAILGGCTSVVNANIDLES